MYYFRKFWKAKTRVQLYATELQAKVKLPDKEWYIFDRFTPKFRAFGQSPGHGGVSNSAPGPQDMIPATEINLFARTVIFESSRPIDPSLKSDADKELKAFFKDKTSFVESTRIVDDSLFVAFRSKNQATDAFKALKENPIQKLKPLGKMRMATL